MALDRKYQKIFGKNAEVTDLGVVGSKNAGNPDTSNDVEELQSLSNWETGLRAQVTASEAPYLQDQNSIFYVITSQLAYLFQAGIAEWNAQTEYVSGRSIVLRSGKIYLAIANSVGIEPEVTANWDTKWIGLTDWMLKGVKYNSSYSSFSGGYSIGERLLYTNNKGEKIYIEALKDNTTVAPSEANIYYIERLKEAEGFVPSTNPNLPTASSSTLGQIYLIIGIVSSEKPSCANVWICQKQNQTYNWVQKSIESVFDDDDTVFVKAGNNNGVYYAKGGAGIIAFNQIGYDNLASYSWIYIPNTVSNNVSLIETYRNGASWYRLYSDGFCEQGGIIDNGSDARNLDKTVTFPLEFYDTNYVFNFTTTRSGTADHCVGAVGTKSKTTSSIVAAYYGDSNSEAARYIMWEAKGYIK